MGRDTAGRLIVKTRESLHCVPTDVETLREKFPGVVARVESLPLASLGDFVRGRISAFEPRESARQALGRVCRDLEGLFESLLAEAFDGHALGRLAWDRLAPYQARLSCLT